MSRDDGSPRGRLLGDAPHHFEPHSLGARDKERAARLAAGWRFKHGALGSQTFDGGVEVGDGPAYVIDRPPCGRRACGWSL